MTGNSFLGENIAYGGVATQSHVLWSYGPHLATDGDVNTCSFTTSREGQRWWQVKFQVKSYIYTFPGSIKIVKKVGLFKTEIGIFSASRGNPC